MLISRPIEVAHWLVDHRQADQPPDTVRTVLPIPTLDLVVDAKYILRDPASRRKPRYRVLGLPRR